MPSLPPGQNYNLVWRFRCNTKTREYFLTVCYYSNDPPAKHEMDHDSLKTQAFEWLLKNGHSPDPDKIKVEFKRLDEGEEPDDEPKDEPIRIPKRINVPNT